ncbi:MAG: M48 family metallopeptidase [Erysipelotrichaceae bacterium]|nr:M48 family metallopeptidase [Erysipelotrichaceae bacterium]
MEKHQIILTSKPIEYVIIYKNMRNIRIRINDGILQVSAPYYTSIDSIEKIIINNQDRLLTMLDQYTPYYQYTDQGFVYIFHQRYTIVERDIGKNKCAIHDDKLYVYTHHIQKCIEAYLKDILMNYIQERIIYYISYEYCLDKPVIQIKKYKGRWGSCYYRDNKVTFNFTLVHLSKDLIDYVIVHELTHFMYPNHSKQFYYEIEKHMSDYKQRIKRLKEEHV